MKAIIIVLIACFCTPSFCQISDSLQHVPPADSVVQIAENHASPTRQVYNVNKWCSGAIIVLGTTGSLLAYTPIMHKSEISDAEIANLNRNTINGFDSWALKQTTLNFDTYAMYSLVAQITFAGLPLTLFLDKTIRKDWTDLFFMLLETNAVAVSLYQFSPLGPLFQNKFRPVVYYDDVAMDQRRSGKNRNSFYSGHVAAASASTFFMAKVYCDYHPEMGASKFLVYTAAAIPPLVLGYFRLRALKHFPSDILSGLLVGMACGIAIPEFHRISSEDLSIGINASPSQIGLDLRLGLK